MVHKLLFPFLFVAALFASHPSHEQTVFNHTAASVVRITGYEKLDPITAFFTGQTEAQYVCSGFVVEPERVLTAAHCLGLNMLADGLSNVVILKADGYDDLALLQVKTSKTPLALRTEPVTLGERVTAVGYGEGFTRLLWTHQEVEITDYTIDPTAAPGIIFQNGFIGGMSGGPVLDPDGAVVAIVQRSDGQIGYGVNAVTIQSFLLGTHD